MAKGKSMRHASALKALRKAEIRRDQNTQVRSAVRTLTGNVLKAIESKNLESAKKGFKEAQSAWQKAARRGIFSKNSASRKISRLAQKISALTKTAK